MKNRLLIMIGLLCASDIYAADVGVGISVKGDDTTIYVPIDVSKNLRVEPYFSNIKGTDGADYNQTTLGVGVFSVSEVAEKTNLLIGARAAYLKSSYYGSAGDNKGYSLTPTLGVEYFPVKNISIGGEVGYEYNHQDFKLGSQREDYATHGTKTALTVKYFFK